MAVALIVFAMLYQPKPKNGGEDLMPSGMDGMMEPNGALPMDDAGLEEGTAEPVSYTHLHFTPSNSELHSVRIS